LTGASPAPFSALAACMGEIAVRAGAIALDYFSPGGKTSATITLKDGGSPVSEADLAVDRFLREKLGGLAPDAGWLSEESTDEPARLERQSLFIVDPIDGTRAFIAGDNRWGISLALVSDARPVAAALYMPAIGELYLAASGSGATLNGASIRATNHALLSGANVGGPRKTLEAMINGRTGIIAEARVPSLAYRLARVGSGAIDAALASTNAWDWDIAAADLIVLEAGGLLTGLDGSQPRYNRERPRHGVLAAAGPRLHKPLLAAVQSIQHANPAPASISARS